MSVAAERGTHRPDELTGAQNFVKLFEIDQFDYLQTGRVEIDIYRSVALGRSPKIGMLIVEPRKSGFKLEYQPKSGGESGSSWGAEISPDGFIHGVRSIGRKTLDDVLGFLVDTEAEPGRPQFQRLAVDKATLELVSFIHVERVQALPKTGESDE